MDPFSYFKENLEASIFAFKKLRAEIGLFSSLELFTQVAFDMLRGRPYHELPAPENDRERLSRQQIAPAILVYKRLKDRVDQKKAVTLTTEIVVRFTVVFLKKTIGKVSDIKSIPDPKQRLKKVKDIGKKFFNAVMSWDRITDEEVFFTVKRCYFAELCVKLGIPELTSAFCRGDQYFFGEVEKNTYLKRPKTLAEGKDSCVFQIFSEDGDKGESS